MMEIEMSTQHTPGPWWVSGDMPGEHKAEFPVVRAFVDGTKAITVCKVGSNNQYRSTSPNGRDFSNARLIAAAPEMLSALRKAVVLLAGVCVHSPELSPHETYEAVSDAIAKATGAAQ